MGDFTYRPTPRQLFVHEAIRLGMTWEQAEAAWDDWRTKPDDLLALLNRFHSQKVLKLRRGG